MKKSKIIGLSLGLAALTATAVATTVITTSCSTVDENLLSGKIASSAFGQIKVLDKLTPPASSFQQEGSDQQQQPEQTTNGYQVKTTTDSATIYIKESKFVEFKLENDLSKIFELDEKQTEELKAYTSTVEWTEKNESNNKDYTLTKDGTFKTLIDLSTYKQDLVSMNLEGTVTISKKPVTSEPNQPGQGNGEQGSEGAPASKTTETTTEEKITKKISIKLFIRRGLINEKGEYVAPTTSTTK